MKSADRSAPGHGCFYRRGACFIVVDAPARRLGLTGMDRGLCRALYVIAAV